MKYPFLSILCVILLAVNVSAEIYTVEQVIDGSTLKLTSGEEVRLIGIDTSKMGQEAKELAQSQFSVSDDGKVVLEFDVEKKDKHGRLLAYVFVKPHPATRFYDTGEYRKRINNETYVFLNAFILFMGYATPVTTSPNVKYAELLERLHREAMIYYRGLWRRTEAGLFTKEICEQYGGQWDRFGEIVIEQCNLPTKDAGKTCSDHRECEGACIAEITKAQKEKLLSGEILTMKGKCAAWTLNYGCYPFVGKGQVEGILCED